jgi:hypothetical protein
MNPKVSFVISVAVAAWVLYDLMAPGEAMSRGLFIMNCFVLFGSVMGAIGAVMKMQKTKSLQ